MFLKYMMFSSRRHEFGTFLGSLEIECFKHGLLNGYGQIEKKDSEFVEFEVRLEEKY